MQNFSRDIAKEFDGYNLTKLKKDIMAGMTVTAVGLPLALAFGVSSGATAAAGIITAIISGIFIGSLSGASFQISGPTGAMGAILIALVQKYGLEGVWIAGAIAGVILIICGVLKLGKIVSYIPTPVITGFTSGIALIIVIGQLENLFGITLHESESAIMKVIYFIKGPLNINWYSVMVGVLVISIMITWPKKLNNLVPSSLVALITALAVNMIFSLPVDVIGEIPKKLILEDRLTFSSINTDMIKGLLIPGISIASLAMIESLLCGEVGKKMTNEKFNSNRELIAQGIGNLVIPFFGGVPATAAIARTSVAIKSGATTRMVSIFHAVFLLISMFILAPVMSQIPLSALAGVLIMTAWKMNEWENISYIFSKKFKGAIMKYLITMMATVTFDLTQAIVIGVIFSSLVFIVKVSNLEVTISEVDEEKLHTNCDLKEDLSKVKVAYICGPLFFATVEKFKEEIINIEDVSVLILSMRGVSLIDTSGIQMLEEIRYSLESKGCTIKLCGLQAQVKDTLSKSGIDDNIGQENIFWSADKAIIDLLA